MLTDPDQQTDLITLCTVCHDAWHALPEDSVDFVIWATRRR